ncbi:MAG: sulfatase-like hydrolase/transferase, partial [Opitutaceae bacterium]
REHPELLKYKTSHGHDQTIVNGISRIGFMSGGESARWVDEDMADVFVREAVSFIEDNREEPFFLFFSTHDIHVPRMPHSRFAGKSGLGLRGDAILQFDWCVGELLDTLDRLELADDTLVILTSDNGPVVDDGYDDGAVENLGGHKPAGPLRGGKYSAFEAGTRVPFIVRWPGHVEPGASSAAFSQVDLLATFAALTGEKVPAEAASDSRNALDALLGADNTGREYIVEHALNGRLGIISDGWKYIEPGPGVARMSNVNIETGYSDAPQLYNLENDIGETTNLADEHPQKLQELKALLAKVRGG